MTPLKLKNIRRGALIVMGGLLLAGCGSSVGLSIPGDGVSASMSAGGYGVVSTTSSATLTSATGSGTSAMSGMTGSASSKVPEVNGIKPVTSQVLATSYWQGMEIQARTTTPVKYVDVTDTDNGVHEKLIKPSKHDSFHLMIMLDDRYTSEPVAYASVWAEILNSKGKDAWSGTQVPMNSAYMGPHYGANVPHLTPGHYTLKLVISPPVLGRHMEYAHVWLKQHTVTEGFNWDPKT